MSSENKIGAGEAEAVVFCCACCGVAESDDIKLKKCAACKSVGYCGVACQKKHRPQHKKACKKRAAELREELLFKQPESSHLGDCPICFLPLPLDVNGHSMNTCCCKCICNGCTFAGTMNESKQQRLNPKCLFCRQPIPKSRTEADKQLKDRLAANDPVALRQIGNYRHEEGDYDSAINYLAKAAAVGDADSHYALSCFYHNGDGVEKDEERERYHLEEAAIAGHPEARYVLGFIEGKGGRSDRAVKHFIIAAKLGHNNSIQKLKECYKAGHVGKDDFASALRGYQAAVEAMKSPQREAGVAAMMVASPYLTR